MSPREARKIASYPYRIHISGTKCPKCKVLDSQRRPFLCIASTTFVEVSHCLCTQGMWFDNYKLYLDRLLVYIQEGHVCCGHQCVLSFFVKHILYVASLSACLITSLSERVSLGNESITILQYRRHLIDLLLKPSPRALLDKTYLHHITSILKQLTQHRILNEYTQNVCCNSIVKFMWWMLYNKHSVNKQWRSMLV